MSYTTKYPKLEGKVVFITGGASGIGAELVKAFCLQGCRVAFIDIDAHAGNTLQQQYSEQSWFKKVDVSDIAALESAIQDAAEYYTGIDILLNNVANDTRHSPEDITPEQWQQCLQVNLTPALFSSKAAYRYMRQRGGGSIINFSSINALVGFPEMAGYISAKAGLLGMTKALAKDFGGNNVRVNAIVPGWVATERQLNDWLTEEVEQKWMETMALKRRILPEDVANLALFLASDDSSMITGQSMVVDGGKT
ncbi:SDR family oxidoreductase [Thalassotalea sp. HSM 43]|uniref:SDR family NAD(P)-dependent oxidoreductase n=1 Tax=Thalassotalea sp. HSM 43 TaxID=2552945 RepID=UPI0010816B7E|nr:SDR family oxidoreductase [Thalassotalea sp. HSM 43]QBY04236.1 SDR family oxidoreductase [Thalassotalea sp. HSM 43]